MTSRYLRIRHGCPHRGKTLQALLPQVAPAWVLGVGLPPSTSRNHVVAWASCAAGGGHRPAQSKRPLEEREDPRRLGGLHPQWQAQRLLTGLRGGSAESGVGVWTSNDASSGYATGVNVRRRYVGVRRVPVRLASTPTWHNGVTPWCCPSPHREPEPPSALLGLFQQPVQQLGFDCRR